MIKVGTDCSGIEAPIQALKMLGLDYEHKFSCDIDKYVKQVSEGVYKPEIWYDDLMERDNTTAPESDLYVAGFPCQAFSIAGKRKGFDDIRGSVFFGVADYIRKSKPKMFILENVKGLLSHEKGRTFQTITDVLAGNGTINGQMSIPFYDDGLDYHLYWQVLNTKNYGVPQNRERVFLVGFRDFQDFSFPKPIELNLKLKDVLQDDVEKKYYLSDEAIKRLTNNGKGFHSAVNEKLEVASTVLASDYKLARGMNILKVTSGTNRGFDIARTGDSIDLQRPTSKTRKGRVGKGVAQTLDTACNQAIYIADYRNDEGLRIRKDGISPCMMSSFRGGEWNASSGTANPPIVISDRIRKLTPLECFRLQGFPDSFHDEVKKLGISDTQMYKMAGNSMTVNVMAAIINKMI